MGIENLPIVNVILANYNYGRYIYDSLMSVYLQNYPNTKIVLSIIDDCSTDNSIEEINRFLSSFEMFTQARLPIDNNLLNLTHFKFTNGLEVYLFKLKKQVGPSLARNVAIGHGLQNKYDYFAILDADDMMLPDKLAKCINTALGYPDQIGAIYADYYHLNEQNNCVRESKEPFDKYRLLEECIVHSGAVISAKAMLDCKDQFGFYDINMRTCEDYDLWQRISEKYIIVHIPEALTIVRVHSNNSTMTVNNEIWNTNRQRVFEKLMNRRNVGS